MAKITSRATCATLSGGVHDISKGISDMYRGIGSLSTISTSIDPLKLNPLLRTQSLFQQMQTVQRVYQQSAFIQQLNALPRISALQKILNEEQSRRQIIKAAVQSTSEFQTLVAANLKFQSVVDSLPASKQKEILDELAEIIPDDYIEKSSAIETTEEIQPAYFDLKQSLDNFLAKGGKDIVGFIFDALTYFCTFTGDEMTPAAVIVLTFLVCKELIIIYEMNKKESDSE